MKILLLPLKKVWFDQVKSGKKKIEYRLYNSYWKKRLIDKEFDKIVLTLGYPKKDDLARRIERPYKGYKVVKIRHPEWGNRVTTCFAIKI